MRPLLLMIASSIGGLPTVALAKGPRPIVAVFDIEARNLFLPPEELEDLTAFLATRLTENGFGVIPRADVRARLREVATESYQECIDESCQISLGRELAASKVLNSRITLVGEACQLSSVLYDVATAASEAAATETRACRPVELLSGVRSLADRLSATTLIVESPAEERLRPASVLPPPPHTTPEEAADEGLTHDPWFWVVTLMLITGAAVAVGFGVSGGSGRSEPICIARNPEECQL